MWPRVGQLIQRALQLWAAASLGQKIGVGVGAGGAISDVVNLDWLRRETIKLAPGSPPAAVEDAARMAARMLGLDGSDIRWPRHTKGAKQGEPIVPVYFVVNLTNGQAWYTSTYNSYKSKRAYANRSYARGIEAGKKQIAVITQAQGR